MIIRTLGWLAATLALATLLLVTGCKTSTSGPTEPSGANLTGGWITQTINGQDVASLGMSAQFTGNQVTFTSADGCQSLNTYTTSGSRIILTVVNDPCTGDPVGKKDTLNYTLAGDQLTIAQGTQTIVMKKGTVVPKAILLGNWNVQTFDGAPPANGNTVTLTIDVSTITQTVHSPTGGTCDLVMSYSRENNSMNVQITGNDCTGEGIGNTDVISYSINGQILTLKYSDGSTMVAKKA